MKSLKTLVVILTCFTTLISCAQSNDPIIGIWDVKTNHYEAIYEIVEHEGKFYGKAHYYNDGDTEYSGDNNKEDYFITGIELKNDQYLNGKMYSPDGSYHRVIFTMDDKDTLVVSMTIEGEYYSETWTRNTTY